MSFKQKTWKDRISEHPARRTLTDVSNNTTKTVNVAREEGTISQEGDAFSAANMNDLEQRVADGFSTLSQDSVKIATKNTTSDSIAFGIDSKGNYGYIKEGADTVTPFKSQKDIDNAYNSGVAAADARVNTGSASYNSGYTNGYNQGVIDGYNSTLATGSGGSDVTISFPHPGHYLLALRGNTYAFYPGGGGSMGISASGLSIDQVTSMTAPNNGGQINVYHVNVTSSSGSVSFTRTGNTSISWWYV